jgi:hypothetical protein
MKWLTVSLVSGVLSAVPGSIRFPVAFVVL